MNSLVVNLCISCREILFLDATIRPAATSFLMVFIFHENNSDSLVYDTGSAPVGNIGMCINRTT